MLTYNYVRITYVAVYWKTPFNKLKQTTDMDIMYVH